MSEYICVFDCETLPDAKALVRTLPEDLVKSATDKNGKTVYQQDYNTMKSLCNTLDQLIKTLTNAKNQYNSNNNRVKNVISQIRV